jgi:putative membrane protein
MYYYPGMSGASMTIWMIVATLFWVAVAALIVWALVRLISRSSRETDTSHTTFQPSAAEILKARFARGEIDGATFRDMMAQLTAADESVAPVKSA